MNVAKVISELKEKYPGKKIVINTPENPTEIICEIEPTETHPERSTAVAVVDKIRPHYHKKLTEIYTIIKGELTHYLGEQKRTIKENESVKIPPGKTHWAEGNETWFYVYSIPSWTPEDHILVFEDKEISRKEFDK